MAMIKRGTATGKIEDIKKDTTYYIYCINCCKNVKSDTLENDMCPLCGKNVSEIDNNQEIIVK